RDYQTLITAMDKLTNEMKSGFANISDEIKSTNDKVNNLELTLEAHKNSFVTYKQVLTFGAWFIGSGLTILGLIVAFLSLIHKP
ncbi:hypothetical protein OAT93_01560, partial [bacterium]|nr:hypothetical protein [bacterium]